MDDISGKHEEDGVNGSVNDSSDKGVEKNLLFSSKVTSVSELSKAEVEKKTTSKSIDSDDEIFNSSSDIFLNGKRKKKKVLHKKLTKIPKKCNNISDSVNVLLKDSCSLVSKKSDIKVNREDSNTEPEVSDQDLPVSFSQDLFSIDHLITSNKCPLCLKVCDSIVVHVKRCALKKGITTRKLFEILKLQKKHDEEREAIGLPVIPEKVLPKRKKKAKIPATGLGSSVELAMALSKSEMEAKEQALIEEADTLIEANLHEEAADKLRTLEDFGFFSSSTSDDPPGTKKDKPPKPSLLSRTQEEREKILTEKVAMVILENDDSKEMEVNGEEFVAHSSPKSAKLRQHYNKSSDLWKLSSVPENSTKDDFYVDSLSSIIEPSNSEPGRFLKHVSQVPGREKTPPPLFCGVQLN